MPREIKFRRPFFRHSDGKFEGFGYWGVFDDEFRSPPSWSHCTHGEDQQHTGLKDRHGVEIYEGSVVKRNNVRDSANEFFGEEKTYIAPVLWQFDCWYVGFGNFKNWKLGRLRKEHSEIIEVIGNIFENKDLLGGV